jgi:hypothetical protein
MGKLATPQVNIWVTCLCEDQVGVCQLFKQCVLPHIDIHRRWWRRRGRTAYQKIAQNFRQATSEEVEIAVCEKQRMQEPDVWRDENFLTRCKMEHLLHCGQVLCLKWRDISAVHDDLSSNFDDVRIITCSIGNAPCCRTRSRTPAVLIHSKTILPAGGIAGA